MKKILFSALYASLSLVSSAESIMAKVTFKPEKIGEPPTVIDVRIDAINDIGLAYTVPITDVKGQISLSKTDSIFFYRPQSFTQGLEDFHIGNFDKAKLSFEKCKKDFNLIKKYDNSYPLLASYYEMECARRSGDYASLRALQKRFVPKHLKVESYRSQVEVYVFWEAYAAKDWERIKRMYPEWDSKNLPTIQRAQIEYCQGVALMETGDIKGARIALSVSLALNQFKEPELFVKAAERAMDLILSDEKVVAIAEDIKNKVKIEQKTLSYWKLIEATSIARMWDSAELNLPKRLDRKYGFLVDIEDEGLKKSRNASAQTDSDKTEPEKTPSEGKDKKGKK